MGTRPFCRRELSDSRLTGFKLEIANLLDSDILSTLSRVVLYSFTVKLEARLIGRNPYRPTGLFRVDVRVRRCWWKLFLRTPYFGAVSLILALVRNPREIDTFEV